MPLPPPVRPNLCHLRNLWLPPFRVVVAWVCGEVVGLGRQGRFGSSGYRSLREGLCVGMDSSASVGMTGGCRGVAAGMPLLRNGYGCRLKPAVPGGATGWQEASAASYRSNNRTATAPAGPPHPPISKPDDIAEVPLGLRCGRRLARLTQVARTPSPRTPPSDRGLPRFPDGRAHPCSPG